MRAAITFLLMLNCYLALIATEQASATILPPKTEIEFVDRTTAAGIKWNLKSLATGPKYLVETMGGGGGFVDYNGDGLLDIYLVAYSQTPQPAG
ncbi:MAG TPA: hypothetical protein VKB46_20890, partial [Pyrinomonadaceae bacterium]|nr:hypothetical protein [Pyrinomonadaceae bacterium]